MLHLLFASSYTTSFRTSKHTRITFYGYCYNIDNQFQAQAQPSQPHTAYRRTTSKRLLRTLRLASRSITHFPDALHFGSFSEIRQRLSSDSSQSPPCNALPLPDVAAKTIHNPPKYLFPVQPLSFCFAHMAFNRKSQNQRSQMQVLQHVESFLAQAQRSRAFEERLGTGMGMRRGLSPSSASRTSDAMLMSRQLSSTLANMRLTKLLDEMGLGGPGPDGSARGVGGDAAEMLGAMGRESGMENRMRNVRPEVGMGGMGNAMLDMDSRVRRLQILEGGMAPARSAAGPGAGPFHGGVPRNSRGGLEEIPRGTGGLLEARSRGALDGMGNRTMGHFGMTGMGMGMGPGPGARPSGRSRRDW